jgi:hypothetical protein
MLGCPEASGFVDCASGKLGLNVNLRPTTSDSTAWRRLKPL